MAELTTPVGRMIGGSIYKLYPLKDNQGNPRMTQNGEPLEQISFGIAIKKGAEQHWNQTEWGKQIYDAAVAAWPNGEYQQPAFSWKIIDGDSQIPNKAMKKPCDQVGYPGSWVIWFSQSWSPTCCNADGSQVLTEENSIMPGYHVQVMVEFTSNNASAGNTAGMYLNPKAVALTAYDEIIESQGAVDVSTAGFGGQALPVGASLTPVAQMPPVQQTVPPVQQTVPPVQQTVPPVQQTVPPVQQTVPPVQQTVPLNDFAAGPIQVTTLAAGQTWEQLQASGWTVETARANGLIV